MSYRPPSDSPRVGEVDVACEDALPPVGEAGQVGLHGAQLGAFGVLHEEAGHRSVEPTNCEEFVNGVKN